MQTLLPIIPTLGSITTALLAAAHMQSLLSILAKLILSSFNVCQLNQRSPCKWCAP